MSTYQELLRRRKDRACAVILSFKEREIDPHLGDSDAGDRLRKLILDQLNDLYELSRDVVSSLEGDDVVFNEVYLRKLDEIHDLVQSINGHG